MLLGLKVHDFFTPEHSGSRNHLLCGFGEVVGMGDGQVCYLFFKSIIALLQIVGGERSALCLGVCK